MLVLCSNGLSSQALLSKFLQRFDQFEEKCAAYEKEYGVNVIRLNDGDGVLMEGENQLLVRG